MPNNLYKTKPTYVQAMEYTRESHKAVLDWMGRLSEYDVPFGTYISATKGRVDGLMIETRWGAKKALFGDWIVKRSTGEYIPVSKEDFEKEYTKVE